MGASAKQTGPSRAEPLVSALRASVPSADDLIAAIKDVPPGWWWSMGTCSVSNDASIGPDVAHCDKETLVRFDSGFHADLPHPSTLAQALRNCVAQAEEAGVPGRDFDAELREMRLSLFHEERTWQIMQDASREVSIKMAREMLFYLSIPAFFIAVLVVLNPWGGAAMAMILGPFMLFFACFSRVWMAVGHIRTDEEKDAEFRRWYEVALAEELRA